MDVPESFSTAAAKRLSSPVVKFNLSVDEVASSPPAAYLKSSPYNNNSNHNDIDNSALRNTTIDTLVNRSNFMMTPNRSGSVQLLSPSRTITESLTSLVSSTGQQLEEVWDQVGYSPEERASQLSDLLFKFHELCEQKIAEERGVAETFLQTILEAKEEIRRTAAALKTIVDPQLLRESNGQTLTDELATLEQELDGLRAAAKNAKEELKECSEYIIDAHSALGIEVDSKWRDTDTDLTAERREEFQRKRAEMKEELSTRSTAVIQLIRDCQHLMNDLHIDETNGNDLDRRILGSLVRSKDGSFILSSKFPSKTCMGMTSSALDELTKRVADLHTLKRRRKAQMQEMGAEIAMLWEKLRVTQDEQEAFRKSVQGYGADTIEKGQAELERLFALKAQMLDELIEEAREMISSLWDQMNAPSEYRRSFEPFILPQSLFNDKVLDQHEEYIGDLQAKLEQMKPILRIIEKREDIIRERMEYEELQKDPERLKQRGAAMARQLMEEEKMAKRIKRDLPRLTELATEKLMEWKEKHGEHFQYNGEVYLDVMDRQEEEWKEYKEGEMQRKLSKKREEKGMVENQLNLAAKTSRATKKNSRPLDEAHSNENVASQPRKMQSNDAAKQAPPRVVLKKHLARSEK